MAERESLRPRGYVELPCPHCGWHRWYAPLDPRLPAPAVLCDPCARHPGVSCDMHWGDDASVRGGRRPLHCVLCHPCGRGSCGGVS